MIALACLLIYDQTLFVCVVIHNSIGIGLVAIGGDEPSEKVETDGKNIVTLRCPTTATQGAYFQKRSLFLPAASPAEEAGGGSYSVINDVVNLGTHTTRPLRKKAMTQR
jgi:hypothetical protein